MDLGLPSRVLIVLLSRGDDFLAPRGATEIERGDRMLILSSKEDFEAVRQLVAESPEPKDA
jgi:Trk K+ transport system NAD-binding subunit